tara:strand:- start:440 stop:1861 length:1422 start_codon:yes stop_codon:yes gene_type:complete
MGFLKKIFRAPRKFVRKVIPKEIRPFAPYITAAMVGPAGLPSLGIGSQGMSRALLAGLTRGVVDDEADFRDVLRTGITAALPNIIETGGNKLLTKFPKLQGTPPDLPVSLTDAEGVARGLGVEEAARLNYADQLTKLQNLPKAAQGKSSILEKIVSGAGKLTSSPSDNLMAKGTAVITAGSADEARKLISEYEEGLDGPYDRKNDRAALFAIFEKAQWGTDDEINDMLDRYGYMGGGSVMPMQTGIAGALPMANTRPGYDMGGGIKMASAVLGGEEDDIAYELFGKPYKDLTPAEIQEFHEEMDRLQKKFMKKDSKENMLMASNAQNDAILERLFEEYLELGFSPEEAAKKAREEFDRMGQMIDTKSDRVMAAEGGIMDLGGMEKDYRNEGGFVPIGEKERADDVPARLSLNEFVMTADAVRNAGDGDIDKGAEVMENVMKNLEEGGSISEESQGKEGARRMFNTMEGMEAVI